MPPFNEISHTLLWRSLQISSIRLRIASFKFITKSYLKKLTEDLIEASKATTGCITVNAEELDINVLLAQACGEYEDKLSQRGLISIMTLTEENPLVFADGGLLWRVFDNLFIPYS